MWHIHVYHHCCGFSRRPLNFPLVEILPFLFLFLSCSTFGLLWLPSCHVYLAVIFSHALSLKAKVTCNSLRKRQQTKSQALSITLTMPRLLEKSEYRNGAACWTAVRLFWELLSVTRGQRRAAAGAVSPGQAGRTVSTALLGTDGHCLPCKGLLGATVPCHSWLAPGHCCEVLLAVLKHLQPPGLDNKVAFEAFASSPALLLFKAPHYL